MSAAALTRGALLSFILLLAVASPATAADDASISHVEPTKDGVKILVSVPQGAETRILTCLLYTSPSPRD